MRPPIKILITGLCIVVLTGCGVTKPSRFYILTASEDSSSQASAATGPALGIGPVRFPAYLDRPEIVQRSGSNQLHYAGSDRWAEPLKSAFSRTLADNLAALLQSDRVTLYPWPRTTRPDYQVSVDVMRFDANADGTVMLMAGWKVIRPEDKSVVARNRTSYTEATGKLDYPAIVAAQSHAVERLSRDIADSIRRARRDSNSRPPGL